MKTDTKSAKGRKSLIDALDEATIVETGKDANGEKRANIRFADGSMGGLNYEVLRKAIIEQGRQNRALLASLGYRQDMVCASGLFSSSLYEGKDGFMVSIEGRCMDRIVLPLSKGNAPVSLETLIANGVR